RVDGEALIYGRSQTDQPDPPAKEARQGAETDRFADGRFDADGLAFGPGGEGEESPLPPALGGGPGRGPRTPRVWAHEGRRGPLPAWESAAANVYLRLFEDAARAQRQESVIKGWATFAAGFLGLPAQPAGPPATPVALGFRQIYYPLFLAGAGERPP